MVTAIAEFDTAAIPVVDASRSPGLSFERRYEIVSEQFADWLVMEPIQFPPQHPTYGWACRVSECEGAVAPTHTTYLCDKHAKQYSLSNPTADVEDSFPALNRSIGHESVSRLSGSPSAQWNTAVARRADAACALRTQTRLRRK